MESIEKLEKELADKENQVAILNQQQTKRGSIIKKEKLRQLEEIQKEDSNLIETLKGELSGLKKVNANLKQEMIYYQKNHDEQQNKIET